MQRQEDVTTVHQTTVNVSAVLVGGPSDLPSSARRQRIAEGSAKIKIMHRDGYEHFEPDAAGTTISGQVIYRWTGRTKIAE